MLKLYHRIFRFCLKNLFKLFFIRIEIKNSEQLYNLDQETDSLIIASNHISNLDPVTIMRLSRNKPIVFVSKKQLFKVPVLGWCLDRCGHISVNRSSPDGTTIRTIRQRLQQGFHVGFFPEGTRSRDGKLKPGKRGLGFLVARTKARVLPMCITGTDRILRKGSYIPVCDQITVRFGKVRDFSEQITQVLETDDKDIQKSIQQQIVDEIMSDIRKLSDADVC